MKMGMNIGLKSLQNHNLSHSQTQAFACPQANNMEACESDGNVKDKQHHTRYIEVPEWRRFPNFNDT